MAYYRAGGYYRGGGYYRAGSIFGTLGKIAKGATGLLAGAAIPGISGIAGAISRAIPAETPAARASTGPQFSTGTQVPSRVMVTRGVEQVGVSPLGTVGVRFRSSRHMNPGNAKAARRAIRRITSVRKMLKSIERQLPMRSAPRSSSRGVITRSEAARALRR